MVSPLEVGKLSAAMCSVIFVMVHNQFISAINSVEGKVFWASSTISGRVLINMWEQNDPSGNWVTHPPIIPFHCLVRADAVFDWELMKTWVQHTLCSEIYHFSLISYVKLYSVYSIHIVCHNYVWSFRLASIICAKVLRRTHFVLCDSFTGKIK